MALYWFQCRHCIELVQAEKRPSSNNCTRNDYHLWTRMAEVGDVTYTCSKCDLSIEATALPNSTGCTGDDGFHRWKKKAII